MRPKNWEELEIASQIAILGELETIGIDEDDDEDGDDEDEFWLLEDEFDDGFDRYLN